MAVKTEYIRDFEGHILGRVETDSQGNKITRDFGGTILNRYDAKNNVTRSLGGQVLARGDVSSSLISDKKRY